jgi:hypothetical protein
MTRVRDVKLAGWAGIATIPLILIPFFITGRFPKFFPYLGDSTSDTFAFMSSNVPAIQVQAMAALCLPLYVWFAAGLVELLRSPGSAAGAEDHQRNRSAGALCTGRHHGWIAAVGKPYAAGVLARTGSV